MSAWQNNKAHEHNKTIDIWIADLFQILSLNISKHIVEWDYVVFIADWYIFLVFFNCQTLLYLITKPVEYRGLSQNKKFKLIS